MITSKSEKSQLVYDSNSNKIFIPKSDDFKESDFICSHYADETHVRKVPVSTKCNQHCKYCFREERSSIITGPQANNIADKIYSSPTYSATDTYVLTFGLTGEPFYDFEAFKSEMRTFQSKFNEMNKNRMYYKWASINIFTNGTLITDEIAKWISEINFELRSIRVGSSGGGALIIISYDGDNSLRFDKKTEDRVLESIGYLKKYNVDFALHSTISTQNCTDFLKLKWSLMDIGGVYQSWSFNRSQNYGFTKENLHVLEEGFDNTINTALEYLDKGDTSKLWCCGWILPFQILRPCFEDKKFNKRCDFLEAECFDFDGNKYPCLELVGVEEFKNKKFKNKDDFTVDFREGCKDCDIRYLCGGSCYMKSYKKDGTLFGIDEVECSIKKLMFKKSFEFMHKVIDRGYSIKEFRQIFGF